MASDKERKNQEEINRLKKEEINLNKKLVDSKGDLLFPEKNLEDQRDISDQIRDQLKNLKFQKTERSEILSINRALNRLAIGATVTNLENLGTQKSINKTIEDRAKLQDALNKLSIVGGNLNELTQEQLVNLQGAFGDLLNLGDQLNEVLKEQQEFSEKVAKNINVQAFQGIANFVKQIPGFRQFAESFEDAAAAAREIVILRQQSKQTAADKEALRTGKDLTQLTLRRLGIQRKLSELEGESGKAEREKLSKGIGDIGKLPLPTIEAFKSLGSTISKSLGIGVFTAVFTSLLKISEETVELQKAFAFTEERAKGFRSNLANAANETDNINITTSALLKTVTALSKQFGFPTLFSTETLITTTKLTQQVGISAEAAGRLAAATVSTRENFEEQYLNALGTSFELQRQAGIQFDLRDILEESGKVTGVVRANLGANIPAIAEAVTQAKLFGGALSDVAGASKVLLDFESSISAELEAELLLGKNINLEKARQAALNGDLVTLTKELTREAGSFEEFTKLNVIQQEALAKSLGMQSDQIADILFQQDIQNKTASELRAAGKEELAQRLEAQSAQEKFTKSLEKIKGLFADAVVAFSPLLDGISFLLLQLTRFIDLVQPIIGLITGAVAGSVVGSAIPIVGNIAGAIAGGAAGFLAQNTADDAIIPTMGYGDTIIKSDKGTLSLNNEDSVAVVAGTNLGGGSNQTGERTNQLLETLIMQNSKKPEISPVGLYEVQ